MRAVAFDLTLPFLPATRISFAQELGEFPSILHTDCAGKLPTQVLRFSKFAFDFVALWRGDSQDQRFKLSQVLIPIVK
jgi:hypothetical protein